ncbi:hypothetical protein VCHA28O22_120080 [Vibrio chagasii]|nr:hypothetical protein VCHA28O22_120080 [Vibrio chagasii]CAH6953453.1 hypothetical protein VCHA50O393_130044 [Vibrio chagasii]CAH6977119.1 hypothetical protein VCHA53O474_130045 [Vibrio chagasii]CAH7001003.1 hypothetical protein VCHA34P112_40217 [Vibrio chagasii]CAH7346219.1 hypothetical protein VCHA56P515_50053 [Vibrio chagasii]
MLIRLALICELDASDICRVNAFAKVSKVDFDICNGVQRPETGCWNFS